MTQGESLFRYYEKLEPHNYINSDINSNKFPHFYWRELSVSEKLNWERVAELNDIISIIR